MSYTIPNKPPVVLTSYRPYRGATPDTFRVSIAPWYEVWFGSLDEAEFNARKMASVERRELERVSAISNSST